MKPRACSCFFALVLAAAAALATTGCDDGGGGDADADSDVDADSDADGDGDADADGERCTGDEQCDDGEFCNGAETCDPESDDADDFGCAGGEPPCGEDETCDEDVLDCVPACEYELDSDGDGHITVDCGGDDCDDFDVNNYPGNVEVCDGDGHDEDCNPNTFGFIDADGDDSGSSACCNGIICGDDCNDSDRSIGPRATDGPTATCDGIDNDCDDTTDEGCPCVEGETRECGTAPQINHVGICEPGVQYCIGGTFTEECSGGVGPQEEVCDGLDNDCDETDDDGVLRTYFADADGDGYGTAGSVLEACGPEPGWAPNTDDCDDTSRSVNPAASEVCNDVDDNCDDLVDEGLLRTYYRDADGDGYGDPSETETACYAPDGFVTDRSDCDDEVDAVHPGALETCDGVDNNCDTSVDPGCACEDGETVACGETDAGECSYGTQRCIGGVWAECAGAVTPRTESCNGADDDCDGSADEDVGPTWYRDADGDGFGLATTTTRACDRPDGFASMPGDCDDARAHVNPAAPESCDGLDNNCDLTTDPGCDCEEGDLRSCGELDVGSCTLGTQRCIGGGWAECVGAVGPTTESCNEADDDCDGSIDDAVGPTWYRDADGDGFGVSTTTQRACSWPDGYASVPGDCDDGEPSINPAATELCDGLDNNCDTSADVGCDCTDGDTQPCGATDVGECAFGVQQCIAGGWATCLGAVASRAEVCNGLDDDCNGSVDNGVLLTYFRDADGDLFGTASSTTQACVTPSGYSAYATDCDDATPAVSPSASELCNGIDDNCAGGVDEGCDCVDGTRRDCGTPDGAGGYVSAGECEIGSQICVGGEWGACIGDVAPTPEVCDGLDNDCDASTDEALLGTPCYVDGDSDGYGAGEASARCRDAARGTYGYCPVGYTNVATDCNDANASIRPGATEECNGIDDDCDGSVDEALVASPCYVDADSDGYGTGPASSRCRDAARGAFGFCPVGYTNVSTDCNDANASVRPGATEVCNAVDDDCDSSVDESLLASPCYVDGDSDGYGAGTSSSRCRDAARGTYGYCPVGYTNVATDCNDSNASIRPGATESCNGADDDCDSSTDEGVLVTYYRDADSDAYGLTTTTATGCSAPAGYVALSGDCDDSNASIHPGASELCDGVDQNCTAGTTDEPTRTYYRDADGDIYGTTATTTTACSPPSGYTEISGDCNDARASIHPGATEICDAADNDCDSSTDEAPATAQCAGVYPFAVNVSSWACTGSCSIGACGTGWGNCDASLYNGCENDLTDDAENCGTCDNDCGYAGLCTASTCDSVVSIAAGDYSSCAVRSSGNLLCWGAGSSGQLANSSFSSSAVPVWVEELAGQNLVEVGFGGHVCSSSDSMGTCWGQNGYGQVGNGSTMSPVLAPALAFPQPFEALGLGDDHTCTLSEDQIYCWGSNAYGELGEDPSLVTERTAVDWDPVGGLGGSRALATGRDHNCVVAWGFDVRCWGRGTTGQLGNGFTADSWTPVAVTGIADASSVACGANWSCAVRTGGAVSCWGYGLSGQLGNGSSSSSSTPVTVSGSGTTQVYTKVTAGEYHTCGLTSGGLVYCWGNGAWGQLGRGSSASSNAPVQVVRPGGAALTGIVDVAAGSVHTCALSGTGDVYCWGDDNQGQLGIGVIGGTYNTAQLVPNL